MRAFAREVIETIALALFLVLVIQAAAQNYRVEGPSMEPLFLSGDRVVVSKVVYMQIDAAQAAGYLPAVSADAGEVWHPVGDLAYGDVIVFKWPRDPKQNFVKRVIGLPGDRIRIELGTVFVNDEPIEEPYVERTLRQSLNERVVEPDSYYVLGDNRAESDDSRHWGSVPFDHVIGKVMVRYWPVDRFTLLKAPVPAL
jgi:signal peptidase I